MEHLSNERALLLQLAEGDEDAFARLLDHYRNHVFFHALTYVKSHEEAEEIVQDIFIKVWDNRARMKDVENFRNYLFILAKHHLISAIRRKVAIIAQAAGRSSREDLLVPDQQLEVKETYHLILEGIEHLSPQQKAVFSLSRFEDLNYEQIGQRLNISKTTVKFHMMLALNHLKEFMRYHSVHQVLLFCCIELFIK